MRLWLTSCLFTLLIACSAQAPSIEAKNAYIVEPLGGRDVALGGLEITALGENIEVLRASSPMAERIEIHTTLTTQSGRSQMRRLEGLTIEANETVTLGPGGVHLMVFGFDPERVSGDVVDITLHYQQGDAKQSQTISARVRELGEDSQAHQGHGS